MIIEPMTREPARAYGGKHGYVYFIQAVTGGPVKIGTALNPWVRMMELQSGNPETLRIIAVRHGGADLERECHNALGADRVRGEWFAPTISLMIFIKRLGYAPPHKHLKRGRPLEAENRDETVRAALETMFAGVESHPAPAVEAQPTFSDFRSSRRAGPPLSPLHAGEGL